MSYDTVNPAFKAEDELAAIRQLVGASDRCVWRPGEGGVACNASAGHARHFNHKPLRDGQEALDQCPESCANDRLKCHPFTPESTVDAVSRRMAELSEAVATVHAHAEMVVGVVGPRTVSEAIRLLLTQRLTDEGRDRAAEEIASGHPTALRIASIIGKHRGHR